METGSWDLAVLGREGSGIFDRLSRHAKNGVAKTKSNRGTCKRWHFRRAFVVAACRSQNQSTSRISFPSAIDVRNFLSFLASSSAFWEFQWWVHINNMNAERLFGKAGKVSAQNAMMNPHSFLLQDRMKIFSTFYFKGFTGSNNRIRMVTIGVEETRVLSKVAW